MRISDWSSDVCSSDLRFIRDQLDSRGIPARYTIDAIVFRTERLVDVVIGDPKRPDLTARIVEVSIGYGFTGPYVSEIRADGGRSEEQTSDIQSLMRISYAVFCLKKKTLKPNKT